jgi:hypothetical protein
MQKPVAVSHACWHLAHWALVVQGVVVSAKQKPSKQARFVSQGTLDEHAEPTAAVCVCEVPHAAHGRTAKRAKTRSPAQPSEIHDERTMGFILPNSGGRRAAILQKAARS